MKMKHPEVSRGLEHKFRCCFCCHVKTGTVIFGIFIALSQLLLLGLMVIASIRPDVLSPQGNETSDEVFIVQKSDGRIFETFGPPRKVEITREQLCISFGFSILCLIFAVLMVYGVARNVASYLMPMFSVQVFDFCLSCLSVVSSFTYAPNIKEIIHEQGLDKLPIFDRLACLDRDYLMLLFVSVLILVLSVQAYLIGMVWSCYKYIQYHVATRRVVREYQVDPDSHMLLPPRYEDAIKIPAGTTVATTGPQPPVYTEE